MEVDRKKTPESCSKLLSSPENLIKVSNFEQMPLLMLGSFVLINNFLLLFLGFDFAVFVFCFLRWASLELAVNLRLQSTWNVSLCQHFQPFNDLCVSWEVRWRTGVGRGSVFLNYFSNLVFEASPLTEPGAHSPGQKSWKWVCLCLSPPSTLYGRACEIRYAWPCINLKASCFHSQYFTLCSHPGHVNNLCLLVHMIQCVWGQRTTSQSLLYPFTV